VTGAWLAAALLLAGLYWRHSGRVAAPLLERRFFARPPFRDLALTAGLVMAAGMGVETYLPLYLRGARAASTTLAAWSVLFLAAGWTVSANVASRLYHRLPEARIAALGAIAMVPILALVGVAVWTEAPLALLFFLYFTMGLAIGMTTNACLTLVQQRAADHEIGRATAAHQFLRNLSVTYGTAAAGAIVISLATKASDDSNALHQALSNTSAGLGGLSERGLATGFAVAHGMGLLLALAAVFAALRLARQEPAVGSTYEMGAPPTP
jgi:predicted MFS family arabinose efflux permease